MLYSADGTSGSVDVINATSNKVTKIIPVKTSLYDFVLYLAVNSKTNLIYVGVQNRLTLNSTIDLINGTTYTKDGSVDILGLLNGISVDDKTNRVFIISQVCSPSSGCPLNGSLYVMGGSKNKIIGNITVGLFPSGVDVNPVTGLVYVVNDGSNTLSVVNEVTKIVRSTLHVGNGVWGVIVNDNTNTTYVTCLVSDSVSVIGP